MSPTAEQVRDMVLSHAGFLKIDGSHRDGLVDAQEAAMQVNTHLRYSGLFREMATDSISSDLIYETPSTSQSPGTPCIYLKVLRDPSPRSVTELRSLVWNHGRIPTLWIISTQGVRIYNAFARPDDQDNDDLSRHLLGQLRVIGNQLEEIEGFHRRNFDDGSFWHSGNGKRIDTAQRVDQALLRDLQSTEKLLRNYDLSSTVAHALLGRTVFVKYLEDRRILLPDHFLQHGQAQEFKALLSDEGGTRSFFAWLRETFNGDLFPQTEAELESVNIQHLDILQRFLSGHVMDHYPETQSGLWPYSFKIVPIELISSIYEMFAHGEDSQRAESQSVHYTRLCLVELMLSLAMMELEDTARVLDPACGSGVFLVEAFRRLAWARAKKLRRALTRVELHEMLRTQVFGIDIDRDAVYVAAFSLYLALLELDPDPRPPDALTFPPLMEDDGDGHPRSLYVQDFFNTQHEFNAAAPFKDKGFDLIVSNPPWTAWKATTAPRDPDFPNKGTQWGLEYIRQHKVPDGKPDQAFLRRARDFSTSESCIAMVIGSRFFHQISAPGKHWRDEFFQTNSVKTIVDLSDLVDEKLLFGSKSSTRLPASVVIFSPVPPDQKGSVRYIAPKWYPGVRKRDELLVTSSDIQYIPEQLVQDDSFRWKTAFRGSPRDIRLLYKLEDLKSLDQILDEIGIKTGVSRGQGITLGKGEKRDASRFLGLPFLAGDSPRQRFSLDVRALPLFSEAEIAKRSNQLILDLPALVVSRSLENYRPCVSLVEPFGNATRLVITHSHYGISFPREWRWLANRLNALLNSSFPLYWAFMTGLELGLGWKLIEIHDWRGMPVPHEILAPNSPPWNEVAELERKLRRGPYSALAEDTRAVEEELDQRIYSLYGVSEQESVLIQDTLEHSINPYLKRKREFNSPLPSVAQLRSYARRVCSQLNGVLRHLDQELTATLCIFPIDTPLRACQFRMRRMVGETSTDEVHVGGIEEILGNMAAGLQMEVADNLYVQRDLRVYDTDGFWIIKPAEARLWSQAAALNDADLIVQEHLQAVSL